MTRRCGVKISGIHDLHQIKPLERPEPLLLAVIISEAHFVFFALRAFNLVFDNRPLKRAECLTKFAGTRLDVEELDNSILHHLS